jgi:hypothetical protein
LSRLRLIPGIVVPVALYVVLRRSFDSDLVALTLAAAIPIAWALALGARQRRVDPIALGAAIVLGAALAIALASGGGSMVLKLRRSAVTGSLGVACLGSVALRRPLLPIVVGVLTRSLPRSQRFTGVIRELEGREEMSVLTAIIGVAALCDAAAQAALAFSVSTTTFVAVAGLVRLAVFAVGLTICGVYLRSTSRRSRLAGERARADPEQVAVLSAGEPEP